MQVLDFIRITLMITVKISSIKRTLNDLRFCNNRTFSMKGFTTIGKLKVKLNGRSYIKQVQDNILNLNFTIFLHGTKT